MADMDKDRLKELEIESILEETHYLADQERMEQTAQKYRAKPKIEEIFSNADKKPRLKNTNPLDESEPDTSNSIVGDKTAATMQAELIMDGNDDDLVTPEQLKAEAEKKAAEKAEKAKREYEEALNVLNLKRENVIRKSAEELALKNDLLRRLIRELVTPGEQKEPLKIYADNKESYFKASYVPIINTEAEKDEPRKLGDVILLKNITEFKELDSAKTTFISTISHELKTPIAAIMMSLQLLEDKRVGALNDEQEQLSKSIKENSERLLGITGELLNMTQVEAGKLQLMPKITKPIELIEYAIKANQVQADKFNIQIEVEYPEEKIGKLFVDSEKIAWVLTNLLSNAIRYSKENGRVVIGAKQEDNIIELYVQDFGKGIDPRYHKSIFDRYFRVPGTKVQGSGLGLSISRDFVEAHGGTLTVESELGKGSRFVIRLKA